MPTILPRVGFTGHQRLSEATTPLVRISVLESLRDSGPVQGVCSLAEGSDQLFADCVIETGGTLMVVVPCTKYDTTFDDPGVLAHYRELLSLAIEVIRLDYVEPSEEAFYTAGQRVVEESERVIAVWDGKPSGGLGGTADIVALAKELGRPVDILWPNGASRR
jgi:hypothetical protein